MKLKSKSTLCTIISISFIAILLIIGIVIYKKHHSQPSQPTPSSQNNQQQIQCQDWQEYDTKLQNWKDNSVFKPNVKYSTERVRDLLNKQNCTLYTNENNGHIEVKLPNIFEDHNIYYENSPISFNYRGNRWLPDNWGFNGTCVLGWSTGHIITTNAHYHTSSPPSPPSFPRP